MDFVEINENGIPAKNILLPDIAIEICQQTELFYQINGFKPPWISYLGIVDEIPVGVCSFKTAPQDGRVEIAYFTFPDNEDRGYATEMARKLIEIARNEIPEIIICAQTLPEENPSTSVLKKLGFRKTIMITHPHDGKVQEWELIVSS